MPKTRKGELIEPLKPIVYYIDPATPEKWKNSSNKAIGVAKMLDGKNSR
jgi:hypothetical protein